MPRGRVFDPERTALLAAGQQRCHLCKRVLEPSEFSPDPSKRTGRYGICRPCCATRTSARRESRRQLLARMLEARRCPPVPVEYFACCGGDLVAGHDRSCFARRSIPRETLARNGIG